MAKLLVSLFLSTVLIACQSSPVRAPNAVRAQYDSEKVSLLKWAAKNRILFQMTDSVFEDVKTTTVGRNCKKLEAPAWSEIAFNSLSLLKNSPELHDKVHVIDIKKSDEPYVSTSQDLDGVTYLIIGYARVETKSLIGDLSEVPCAERSASYMNEEKLNVSFQFPQNKDVIKAVKELTKREIPDRWKFKTQFLNFLADRLTVFKINPELTFERSAEGTSFLASFLSTQSDMVANQQLDTIDYWLNELSLRSHSAAYLKVFGLAKDKDLNFGMGFQPQSQGHSYPYLTYKVMDGHYTYPSLTELEKCLGELSNRYKRSLASISSDISTHPENFLSPGYSCR